MRMISSLRLFSSALALVVCLPQAHAAQPANIWYEIPFVKGADFNELESTISQTQDSMRDSLMRQFGSMLIPMVEDGADAGEAGEVLLQALQSFDGVYNAHKNDAERNLGVSLASIFRADFDELYSQAGLPDSARRAQFVGNGAVESQNLALQVGFIMYGSFTIGARRGYSHSPNVILTLTVLNYLTGASRSFRSNGSTSRALQELAQKVFNFFQSNQYPDWVNPQPQLTWIVPPGPVQPASAISAVQYCRGQGARLPYASELVQASQGSQYRPGGIPALVDGGIYPVADRDRYNEQYYYFVGDDAATGGPVRTDAGFGTISGNFDCVQGDPSQETLFVQSIYRMWRKTSDQQVRNALDYLLVQMSEYGANPDDSELFPSSDAAIALLRSKGITLNIPAGLLSD